MQCDVNVLWYKQGHLWSFSPSNKPVHHVRAGQTAYMMGHTEQEKGKGFRAVILWIGHNHTETIIYWAVLSAVYGPRLSAVLTNMHYLYYLYIIC